jgi:hypothetical protein
VIQTRPQTSGKVGRRRGRPRKNLVVLKVIIWKYLIFLMCRVGPDRYGFFRADTDTDI